MENWRDTPWICGYAEHFRLPADDVKLVYEVFLGDRIEVWPHPFGEVAGWVRHWDSQESLAIRQAIWRERGWDWDSVGAKVLQNELYRRAPWAVDEHQRLREVVSDFGRQRGSEIRLLDYGCGTGNFVGHLADLPGVSSDLWETDPVVLGYCAHKFRDNPGVRSCNLIPSRHPLSGDACRVSTLRVDFGREYDVIHAMDVLEHTLDPLAVLMNLNAHLAPGGLLLFNYPDYIEGDWHTPEAHYLRPFCLFYAHLLFTQDRETVFRKTCPPAVERRVNRLARAFDAISRPFVRRRALASLRNSPYARKYSLE